MELELPDFDLSALESMANSFFYASQAVNGQGAVMGKLGLFPFFMHHNEFKTITETLNADFSSYKPIKGQEVLGDSGGFSGNITLNGILVAEPIHAVEPLKWLLKMRNPLRFTTLESDIEAVITSLTATKTYFTIHGTHRVQTYNITLKEVYGSIV